MPDFLREAVKILAFFMGYFAIAPALGIATAFRPILRPFILATMFACTALPPGWFTLTIFSQDAYRGHVRGWQCSVIEILALSLIIEACIARREALRGIFTLITPFLIYLILCSISIFVAWDSALAGKALFKYWKGLFILCGTFCAIRDKNDIRLIVWVLGASVIAQLGVGLWQRYIEHVWRVNAMFEHSNSMAMWCYCIGILLFASALRPGMNILTTFYLLFATASAGALVIMSLARASLAAFAAGCAAAVIGTALTSRSIRLLAISAWISIAAVLMIAVSYDSITERIDTAAEIEEDGDLRPIMIEQARAMLEDHTTGVGWNNFNIANSLPQGEKYSRILEDWNIRRGHRIIEEQYLSNPMTESLWWLHLSETGYFGLVGLLIFMTWSYWFALHAWWRHRHTILGGTALGILLVFSINYPHGTYERIIIEPKNFATWLLLIGIAARMARLPASDTADSPLFNSTRQNFKGSL